MSADTAAAVERRLRELGNPETARVMQRFFKTGPGEYGEGDLFLGIKAPQLRLVVREFRDLSLDETERLLASAVHDCRAIAVLLLVQAFGFAYPAMRKEIYERYLRNTSRVNNWDLVDASAPGVVGAYLFDRSRKPLYRLARSKNLWERRIAIVATQHFIRRDDFADTLGVAQLLIDDSEDLIHKAVGWMLREVGKRDQPAEEAFLLKHYQSMPRTMLRYAIERFAEKRRRQYLEGRA